MIRLSPFLEILLVTVLAMPAAHAESSSSSSSSSTTTTASKNGTSTKHSSSSTSTTTHYDQDDARDALRKGKVMPLTAILMIVAKREPGTVMSVDLETKDGALTYRIDVLSDTGRKARLRMNALTGETLTVEYR